MVKFALKTSPLERFKKIKHGVPGSVVSASRETSRLWL